MGFLNKIFGSKEDTESKEYDNEGLYTEQANEKQKAKLEELMNNDEIEPGDIPDEFEMPDIDSEMLNEMEIMGNDVENYDEAINALLEEDAKIEMPEIDYEIIKSVSTYDPDSNTVHEIQPRESSGQAQEAEPEEEEEEEDNTEKIKADKRFYSVTGIICGLIVAAMIAMIVMFFGYLHKRTDYLQGYSGDGVILNQTTSGLNSANYIYVDQSKTIGEKALSLSKMLVNSANTVFYFDGYVNTQKYNFTLKDDSGNSYAMELYFAGVNEESNETMIKFEPLKSNITKTLTLHVEEPETGKTTDFEVVFDRQLTFTPVRYLAQKKTVYNDEYRIEISNAVFSSADSVIEYSIIPEEDMGYSIVQGIKKDAEYVTLEELGGEKTPLADVPAMYSFENGISLARMDFASLLSLESDIKVDIKNLYKKYDTDIEVPASSLSQKYDDNKQFSFEVGNYKLVCEGLKQFNDKYVFTFHCEDKDIPADANDAYANRVEAIVEAQLVGKGYSGMEINLDGMCTSEYMGTDMIIPLDDNARNFVSHLSRDEISMQINSVMVKTDDVSFSFDRNSLIKHKDYTRNLAEEFIKESFEKRLAYKSGMLKQDAITGFQDDILKDSVLMSNYTPMQTTSEPEYSAQVVMMMFRNEDGYAVVREVWKGIDGSKETHFYRTHKIHFVDKSSYWIIESDEIIK